MNKLVKISVTMLLAFVLPTVLWNQNLGLLSVKALDTPVGNWQDMGNYSTAWYGDGSSGAFTINSADELAGLAKLVNAGNTFSDKTVTLSANLDLSAHEWTSIGNSAHPFSGSFNGQNYVISNLFINQPSRDWVGLFGNTSGSTVISNITLNHVNIVGSWIVGGLVGDNFGTITNSAVEGSVTGYANVGGLVGRNFGEISDSHVSGEVTSTWSSGGGLVGQNLDNIQRCYTSGTVYGDFAIGGLVGENYGTFILDSYSTSDVVGTSTSSYVGGLVGLLSGTAMNSYAVGEIVGGSSVGGLVGENYRGAIINAYASGAVVGNSAVGGLAGSNYNGTTTDSFWDTESTGQTQSAGGVGKSTQLMKQQTTFTNWDFTATGNWAIESGSAISYPYLLKNTQTPAPGLEILTFLGTVTVNKDNSAWTNDEPEIRLSSDPTILQNEISGTVISGVTSFSGLENGKTYYVWVYSETASYYTGHSITDSADSVTLNFFTINYDGHGATEGSMVSKIVLENKDFKLDHNSFGKSGYIFSGWNTAADGSGTNYSDEATYTVASKGETLYAQWALQLPDTGVKDTAAVMVLVLGLVLLGLSHPIQNKKTNKKSNK